MTKKELKEIIENQIEEYIKKHQIEEYIKKHDKAFDTRTERDYNCKIAALETLAYNLNIKLWEDKFIYPVSKA